jgi:hypothetical protein
MYWDADTLSEIDLLSESQLGALAGSRASVAMIEVSRLSAEDAFELIRKRQPTRDAGPLPPNFSSPQEADAARQLVELLDGYTLAVEQAAVYLDTGMVEPSELLALRHCQLEVVWTFC